EAPPALETVYAAAIVDRQHSVPLAQEKRQVTDVAGYMIDPLLSYDSLNDVVDPAQQPAALIPADGQPAIHPGRKRPADGGEDALHAEVLGRNWLALEMGHNHGVTR